MIKSSLSIVFNRALCNVNVEENLDKILDIKVFNRALCNVNL